MVRTSSVVVVVVVVVALCVSLFLSFNHSQAYQQ